MRALTLWGSSRWLASIFIAIAVVLVGIAWYGSSPAKAAAWAAHRPAADEKPCPGERSSGRPFKGDRSPASVQGDGQRPHGLVRPDRGIRCRAGQEQRPELRPQARQHRDLVCRLRSDGHTGFADGRRQQVRAGGRPLPGRARLHPHPHSRPGTERIPARQLFARRRCRPWVQPVHPDRRQHSRLQRTDRGDRRRTV